ncbi:hypothetical protein [Paraburkholderia sacchari]|uniref:hypothetical protein n=1 Tax=Paraburkholderia sacchari TaxID=159450 RepID=UPI001BCC1504|nr:hypothetical protein [Paraburkholderia sacchari]
MSAITEKELMLAAETGGVLRLTLKANGTAFEVHAKTARGDEMTLVKTRRQDGLAISRRFTNPAVALAVLHKAGIHEVTVNLESWVPDARAATPPRPDTAARMKEAHKALSKQREQQATPAHSTISAPVRHHTLGATDVDAASTSTPDTTIGSSEATTTDGPPASPPRTGVLKKEGGIKVEVRKKRPSPKTSTVRPPVSRIEHSRKSGIKTDIPVDAYFISDHATEKSS